MSVYLIGVKECDMKLLIFLLHAPLFIFDQLFFFLMSAQYKRLFVCGFCTYVFVTGVFLYACFYPCLLSGQQTSLRYFKTKGKIKYAIEISVFFVLLLFVVDLACGWVIWGEISFRQTKTRFYWDDWWDL